MADIKPYEAELKAAQAGLAALLLSGKGSASELAVARRMVIVMARELTTPKSVLVFDTLPADKHGYKGAKAWLFASQRKADEEINPQFLPSDAYARKGEEYLKLGERLIKDAHTRQSAVIDKQRGKSYLILDKDPHVADVMKDLASELFAWFKALPNAKPEMSMSAEAGLATMLAERPDLVALVRLVQTLPLDVEIRDVPVDRPASVEAIELAIALVPYVGSAVAAYEAYAGEDLFGYKLTDIERGILGASVLLPIAGRLFKGGRALYTEARLVSLYGRDAAAWTKVTAASGRAERAAGGKALNDVERANIELLAQKKIAGQIAKDGAAALPSVVHGAGGAAPTIDPAITKLLAELQIANSAMKSLDGPSLQRILEKGPYVDHLKGQLLEELIESRLVPWLRNRTGSFALGVTVPAGKKLEFIPGHLIRDINGRQITDGVLAFRDGGKLVVVAVFEAKAGKSAARELSHAKSSLSSLTKDELTELRANAKDAWRAQQLRAQRKGQPFKLTVDDVMKQYALSELGGQVRRDIERLAAGGKTFLQIGSEELVIKFSPTQTKFFGVLPKDVATASIESQLKKEKVVYEMLGVDIKGADLKSLAEKMKALAEKMAAAAP